MFDRPLGKLRLLRNRFYPMVALFLVGLAVSLWLFGSRQQAMSSVPGRPQTQEYDVIVFGDEIPGVMTALKLKQQLPNGRVALLTEGDIRQGIGGHLIRGGLAYLDRNQVPKDIRDRLGLQKFHPSSKLYDEFIKITETQEIALDRVKADRKLKQALQRAGVTVIGNIQALSVQTKGSKVQALTTNDHGTFTAKFFIDATQGGKLADMAGVDIADGFEAIGLPNSSLSVGWVFEIYGLNIKQFQDIEAQLNQRLLDPNDAEAQRWLDIASGGSPGRREQIIKTLGNSGGSPSVYQATPDSADVRSSALGVVFHGMNNSVYDLRANWGKLDRANIAVLGDHLSFNSMLFYADSQTSRQLSLTGAKPTPQMAEFARKVQDFYKSLGATEVKLMPELYIRSAGHIARSLDDLTATDMAGGGVPADQALGTFSYHLDVRGGITGIGERANSLGFGKLNIHTDMPAFNYGFRHTLPVERDNLAVLSPASGFGGLGVAAGRIVEFNVSVGEGLAIATAKALKENRTLHSITNREVRQTLNYTPLVYGRPSSSYDRVKALESLLKQEREREQREVMQRRNRRSNESANESAI